MLVIIIIINVAFNQSSDARIKLPQVSACVSVCMCVLLLCVHLLSLSKQQVLAGEKCLFFSVFFSLFFLSVSILLFLFACRIIVEQLMTCYCATRMTFKQPINFFLLLLLLVTSFCPLLLLLQLQPNSNLEASTGWRCKDKQVARLTNFLLLPQLFEDELTYTNTHTKSACRSLSS